MATAMPKRRAIGIRFRSLAVEAEVVEPVERAGGRVLAVDVGNVTNESAAQWLSGTMLGARGDNGGLVRRDWRAHRRRSVQDAGRRRGG
jgi:hypothetical protein